MVGLRVLIYCMSYDLYIMIMSYDYVTRTEPRGNKVMRTRESPKRKVTLLNSLHDERKGEPIQLITQEEVRNPKARIVRGLDSGA